MEKTGVQIFCSWSGGKDSCLALHRAAVQGAVPKYLMTMFTPGGERSRSHGLDIQVVRAQAEALGLPLITAGASWQDYEAVFLDILKQLKKEQVSTGVFGDIDIEDHRAWVTRVCNESGSKAWHPLWQQDRMELLKEFVSLGYRAMIVSAREDLSGLLGRVFDGQLILELGQMNIDPCGEQGEFHTVVVDGPLFAWPLSLEPGKVLVQDGYSFLDYRLKAK